MALVLSHPFGWRRPRPGRRRSARARWTGTSSPARVGSTCR